MALINIYSLQQQAVGLYATGNVQRAHTRYDTPTPSATAAMGA